MCVNSIKLCICLWKRHSTSCIHICIVHSCGGFDVRTSVQGVHLYKVYICTRCIRAVLCRYTCTCRCEHPVVLLGTANKLQTSHAQELTFLLNGKVNIIEQPTLQETFLVCEVIPSFIDSLYRQVGLVREFNYDVALASIV